MAHNAIANWTQATAGLAWGKQRTLHDTLALVAEEKVKVVWGANDFKGSPCLINAVGCMVKSQNQAPMDNEPRLVSAFDDVCSYFHTVGVVKDKFLTPLAAEILLRNFAELKPVPEAATVATEAKYVEPKDRDVQAAFEQMLDTPAPVTEEESFTENEGLHLDPNVDAPHQ